MVSEPGSGNRTPRGKPTTYGKLLMKLPTLHGHARHIDNRSVNARRANEHIILPRKGHERHQQREFANALFTNWAEYWKDVLGMIRRGYHIWVQVNHSFLFIYTFCDALRNISPIQRRPALCGGGRGGAIRVETVEPSTNEKSPTLKKNDFLSQRPFISTIFDWYISVATHNTWP